MGDRPRHPGALRAWLTWWVLLAALWLALVDTVVVPELVVGAVAAAIAATGAVIVRSQRRLLLRPRLAWVRCAGAPLRRAVTDLVPLARALWRRGVRRRDERGSLPSSRTRRSPRRPTRDAPRVHPGARVAGAEHARGRRRRRPARAARPPARAHRRPGGRRRSRCPSRERLAVGGDGARRDARAARAPVRAPAGARGHRGARGGRDRHDLALLLVAQGTGRQPFGDLALVLAVVSFVGAVAYLRFVEAFREE